MIYYDSHRWRSLLRLRGSILPVAMAWAFPSAVFSFCLKYAEVHGFLDLDHLEVVTQGDIYSGFTFVLGFSLVFRTSQAYTRYWSAATSIHEMASEWGDSCTSLIAFASASEAPADEIHHFRHTVVRLFSLLHAMAMSELARMDAPLLDVQGLNKKNLKMLTSGLAQGRKVQIVLCKVKAYITQMADKGVLKVPAPILTRVFQELGSGLVKFHTAQQVVIWPFPFPYTQLNVLLIMVYTVITPLVLSTWTTRPWVVSLFSFISVSCMMGLDLIASELENPFGNDPNDLPVYELQQDMNKFLTVLLEPTISCVPELVPDRAVLEYDELVSQCQNRRPRMSLTERLSWKDPKEGFRRPNSNLGRKLTRGLTFKGETPKLSAQKKWTGDEDRNEEVERVRHWLEFLPSEASAASLREAVSRRNATPRQQCCGSGEFRNLSPCDESDMASQMESPTDSVKLGSLESLGDCLDKMSAEKPQADPVAVDPCPPVPPSCQIPMTPESCGVDMSSFINSLHKELREHLAEQRTMRRTEINELRGLIHAAVYAEEPPSMPADAQIACMPHSPPQPLLLQQVLPPEAGTYETTDEDVGRQSDEGGKQSTEWKMLRAPWRSWSSQPDESQCHSFAEG